MSRKERERMVILSRVRDKELARREAASVLGLSLRHVHRLYQRYLAQGDRGLVHRSRGRASPRRIEEQQREHALSLYRSLYRGFGPTLLAEKLGPDHGIWVSHDTARRWLIEEGLLEKSRKGRRCRRRRVRKQRFGQMLQMDGSHHAWFGSRGPACCLMVIVDDATGRTLGRFHHAETTFAAMDLFGRWCEKHGLPQSLYVDRHGIYRADRDPTTQEIRSRRKPLTQFGRAMGELDVRLILAQSPQAKGRVERKNGTLQDRLVKELALAKIGSVDEANAWLDRSGFFDQLDEKFCVEPADATDAHRPLVTDLKDVLCVKEKRHVGNDACLSWRGRTLQLLDARAGLRQVEVWEQADGSIAVIDGGRRLKWIDAADHRATQVKPRRVIRNNKRHKPQPHQQFRLNLQAPPRKPSPPQRLQKAG